MRQMEVAQIVNVQLQVKSPKGLTLMSAVKWSVCIHVNF